MSATEQVLAFVRSATPPVEALGRARVELSTFHQAARRGEHSPVVRALGELSVAADTPAWLAWLTGTSAVLGSGEQPESPAQPIRRPHQYRRRRRQTGAGDGAGAWA